MSGHIMSMGRGLAGTVLLLACMSLSAWGASGDKDAREKAAKVSAELKAPQNAMDRIEGEVAAEQISVPAGMDLELEWYSPNINAAKYGRVLRGWIREDLALLETDKHYLVAVRRTDGVERWYCELTGAIRYAPAVSRNSVLVNLNNYLVAIDRNLGEVRWQLLPAFAMSCAPLIVDPPVYPREYTRTWQPLESIYVGGWDGRFYFLQVRGRLASYGSMVAADFDLFSPWHKTHKGRGLISSPAQLRDNILYYTATDKAVYSWTRDGDEREPYYMLGEPTTPLTLTSGQANSTASVLSSIYVGARDNSVYCLDRLTLRKKWVFSPGVLATGTITADEAATPMVYVPTVDGLLHALRVTPARVLSGGGVSEVPESAAEVWQAPAGGVITTGSDIVYLGLGRDAENPIYKGIAAVDKASGKVLWKNEGGIFTTYLQFQNSWSKPDQAARVYAVTADNRLVSLKEKIRATGMRKAAEPAAEQPKAPAKKAAKADEAAPKPDEAPKAN